jgi:hypothetical protein
VFDLRPEIAFLYPLFGIAFFATRSLTPFAPLLLCHPRSADFFRTIKNPTANH